MIEHDLDAELLGVALHALHQVGALQIVRVAGPVLDLGGGHELAALFHAGYQHRIQVGPRGVDARGIARRPGAQDE